MQSTADTLIPSPPVVRERLAAHAREGRLLKSLLRLSIRASQERHAAEHACRHQDHRQAVVR